MTIDSNVYSLLWVAGEGRGGGDVAWEYGPDESLLNVEEDDREGAEKSEFERPEKDNKDS